MKRLALLSLMALVVAVLPAHADLGGFVITSFHADLEVQDNAELLVTERIEITEISFERLMGILVGVVTFGVGAGWASWRGGVMTATPRSSGSSGFGGGGDFSGGGGGGGGGGLW